MTEAHSKPIRSAGTRSVAGLFAGIGGIELGLSRAGFQAATLCEYLPEARAVLRERFPNAACCNDVRQLVADPKYRLPEVEVVTAGFPCQDLSQCGRMKGIVGSNSGLVNCLFELLKRRRSAPRWVVIENVPFMLRLDRGRAMSHITRSLERLGFAWAYRVVDARSFGLPQRRERVIIVASRVEDPASVLFADEEGERSNSRARGEDQPCGFYWTEGNRGLGWAVDSVPALKAGSTIGIPSPPAIWLPAHDVVVTPRIDDAEAFQGLPRGWTGPATQEGSERSRWRLVGNAVPVPIAEWIGTRLIEPGDIATRQVDRLPRSAPWPQAGFGTGGKRYQVEVSAWPVKANWRGLERRYGRTGTRLLSRPRLSPRAAAGFFRRIVKSSLRTDERFIPSLKRFIDASQVGV
jgi:DNA (cytosine-5)-methyltransferase 1